MPVNSYSHVSRESLLTSSGLLVSPLGSCGSYEWQMEYAYVFTEKEGLRFPEAFVRRAVGLLPGSRCHLWSSNHKRIVVAVQRGVKSER